MRAKGCNLPGPLQESFGPKKVEKRFPLRTAARGFEGSPHRKKKELAFPSKPGENKPFTVISSSNSVLTKFESQKRTPKPKNRINNAKEYSEEFEGTTQ